MSAMRIGFCLWVGRIELVSELQKCVCARNGSESTLGLSRKRTLPLVVARLSENDSDESSRDKKEIQAELKKFKREKTLEEEMDEIDDLVMNRAPVHEGKVLVFGAWLDESVAGRKVGRASRESVSDDAARAEQCFDTGIKYFHSGRYGKAVSCFEDALQLAGLASSRGGEYVLWLAQAYDANGDKDTMKRLLTTLDNHPDRNVKKVAAEVMYILTAPALTLDERNFVKVPTLEAPDRYDRKRKRRPVSGAYGKKPEYATMRKGPEMYSLEWFLERAAPPETDDMSPLLIASIALFSVVLLAMAYL